MAERGRSKRGKGGELGRPVAVRPRAAFDDDRPTEIRALDEADSGLQTSREQRINGSTISDMIKSEHKLSQVLGVLLLRASQDLPGADIDPRATLTLHHEFEFDRRVGYRLELKLYNHRSRCIEVKAEVDADGRAIRSGSMISRTFPI